MRPGMKIPNNKPAQGTRFVFSIAGITNFDSLRPPDIFRRSIQQSVKQSIENMTSFKVAEVDVHVLDVNFDEPAPMEKEAESSEEFEDEEEQN